MVAVKHANHNADNNLFQLLFFELNLLYCKVQKVTFRVVISNNVEVVTLALHLYVHLLCGSKLRQFIVSENLYFSTKFLDLKFCVGVKKSVRLSLAHLIVQLVFKELWQREIVFVVDHNARMVTLVQQVNNVKESL